MADYNLIHRNKLLADIAAQLRQVEETPLVHVRVRLFVKGGRVVKEYLGLAPALHDIVEDVYWDDEGNWAHAERAEVDTY